MKGGCKLQPGPTQHLQSTRERESKYPITVL